MKVALCQIDSTVGDFTGNARRIVEFAARAHKQGAQLAVFPELAICGYPPEDLLVRPGFLAAHDRALQELAAHVPPDLCVLLGCLEPNPDAATRGGRPLFNAVARLEDGLVQIVARKSLLPTYDVFDESRYFEPWQRPQENVITVAGRRVGMVVCEDGWNDAQFFARRIYQIDPVECVVKAGAQLVVNLSASPWSVGKERFRHKMVQAASERHQVPMLYVNLVGGNVELQFDGGSLAVKPGGVAFQPVLFDEALVVVDTEAPWTQVPRELGKEQLHHDALVQGLGDYARKFGFPKAVIGLSGGIDSAVVAALAVDALGAANVVGIGMPSRYSSQHSIDDARALAQKLGMPFHLLPIAPLQDSYAQVLRPVFGDGPPGLAEENLQARMRGALLMAFANKHGHLLLTTGNKSECAVGYCTLYGDTCGALAPIADLWKTEVWALARWINRNGERIPKNSIDKPPSAELRPDQLDTDSLPPYPELDPVLKCLVEDELSVELTAAKTGMARARVAELFAKVQAAEFKRYQYAPALRVSERCWSGRRMPVSHRYRES
ncbi:MAG: NAD+ synthase [Planctomycetes bacterium]|nr:NAD+ synthase [Planctomycetota bacterium]